MAFMPLRGCHYHAGKRHEPAPDEKFCIHTPCRAEKATFLAGAQEELGESDLLTNAPFW
jgi:hypothetical protein